MTELRGQGNTNMAPAQRFAWMLAVLPAVAADIE
jgi:hypothetical protein